MLVHPIVDVGRVQCLLLLVRLLLLLLGHVPAGHHVTWPTIGHDHVVPRHAVHSRVVPAVLQPRHVLVTPTGHLDLPHPPHPMSLVRGHHPSHPHPTTGIVVR